MIFSLFICDLYTHAIKTHRVKVYKAGNKRFQLDEIKLLIYQTIQHAQISSQQGWLLTMLISLSSCDGIKFALCAERLFVLIHLIIIERVCVMRHNFNLYSNHYPSKPADAAANIAIMWCDCGVWNHKEKRMRSVKNIILCCYHNKDISVSFRTSECVIHLSNSMLLSIAMSNTKK